ncbi:hypothetical protein RFI_04819 [Reticulomyxa filosa]|uniref:Uncharacterized protein n=1 Tax=Reticulomyxa filosa TaxID=46433 RepID=X6P252_RETFI|nr:hypothetical protein RFI_04819 [Reticulomyxa filosa]|eukprot:ETO32296.1 hypothetical protein RFI_04819 [Reticulomyxa filosa]
MCFSKKTKQKNKNNKLAIGTIMLPVVITIPNTDLLKFKENDLELYKKLLFQIDRRMSQMLKTEEELWNKEKNKKKKTNSKKSQNASKYITVKNAPDVDFAYLWKDTNDLYWLCDDLNTLDSEVLEYECYEVSSLVLQIFAVCKGGFLPFNENGDIEITEFFKPIVLTKAQETAVAESKNRKKNKSKTQKTNPTGDTL